MAVGATLARLSAPLCLSLACAGPARIEAPALGAATPWTHLEVADAPDDFRFALVADRTGGARGRVFEMALEKLALLRPAFVLSVGDLIEGYTTDRDRLDLEWAELDALVGRLEMPFFYAPGNHDYSNTVMAEDWVRRFGASYYHFRYRDVLFLVLNSELFSSVSDPSRGVEGPETLTEQMAFAERTLADHADARWTVVVVHKPLWDRREVHPEWERFESWLGARPYTVFAGHYHAYTKHSRRGRSYLTLATSGGGSRLRGIERGEFDHLALVQVSAEGPVVANLMLDGIHGEDVRTAATRSLVDELLRVVKVEPLRPHGPLFRRGIQRVALSNGSDRPVRVRARFEAGPGLRATPASALRELAPGAHEILEVELHAATPRPAAELTPGTALFELEADGARGPVRVESRGWLVADPIFAVARAPRPIRVDGSLEEWPPLRFAMQDWPRLEGGRAEASLRFDAVARDETLYLAVEVLDPTPVADPALPGSRQDGVRISLDARPDPERSRNPSLHAALKEGLFSQLLLGTLSPRGAAPSEEGLIPPLPESVGRAVLPTDTGYRAELAVPFAWLDERAGGPWRRFRLNWTLLDFRPGESEGQSHSWRPIRYGLDGLPIEGAGTFERAGSDQRDPIGSD